MRGARSGFTLVELAIVVGIIGVLASLAIPQYTSIQYTARRAEVPSLVDSLHSAEIAYFVANDEYLIVDSFVPRAAPDRVPTVWPAESGFSQLDWSPDGLVRGIYKIEGSPDTNFQIVGQCDVDGDEEVAEYVATHTTAVQRVTPGTIY